MIFNIPIEIQDEIVKMKPFENVAKSDGWNEESDETAEERLIAITQRFIDDKLKGVLIDQVRNEKQVAFEVKRDEIEALFVKDEGKVTIK